MNRFLSARAQNTRQNTRAIDPASVGAAAGFGRPNVNFGNPGAGPVPTAGNPMMNPAIRDAVMGVAPAPATPAAPTPAPARAGLNPLQRAQQPQHSPGQGGHVLDAPADGQDRAIWAVGR